MVEDPRARQQGKIAKMDAILEKLEAGRAPRRGRLRSTPRASSQLKHLRSEMQEQLDA